MVVLFLFPYYRSGTIPSATQKQLIFAKRHRPLGYSAMPERFFAVTYTLIAILRTEPVPKVTYFNIVRQMLEYNIVCRIF